MGRRIGHDELSTRGVAGARRRVQGAQKLPACVWVETLDDALTWLGKRKDWERFSAQVSTTRQTHSALLPWLERRPQQALELSAEWPQLLAVVTWLVDHQRPGIYLRQVDLPGVHSKLIEAHRGVLAELLDLALPVDAVDSDKTGISQFSARYGFLEKPTRIRFRVLDPSIRVVPGLISPDVTLDADSFSRLDLDVQRVFITENEINFLAFPAACNAIVIFGAGYGWDALSRSRWLNNCSIHYWGDIDTHGFGILDQLRGHFDHVVSFLMDRATLDEHASVWGREDKPLRVDLHRLHARGKSPIRRPALQPHSPWTAARAGAHRLPLASSSPSSPRLHWHIQFSSLAIGLKKNYI